MKPFETARWTSCAVAPGRIAVRRPRGTPRRPRTCAGSRRRHADRARDLHPVHPRPGDLERRDAKSPSTGSLRAIANSAPTSTMFIVSRPQPRSTKSSSAGAITSAAVCPARTPRGTPRSLPVDADPLAHRLDLELALHCPREIELEVEGHDSSPERARSPGPPSRSPARTRRRAAPVRARAQRCTRRADRRTPVSIRRPMLADVARFGREDDLRLAVRGRNT